MTGAAAEVAALALGRTAQASVFDPALRRQIHKQQGAALRRLQTWIQQPSIAAENIGMAEGCELTMELLREAGFHSVAKVPTEGQPGIFATLDAGAARTVGLYFMYDVKQADPKEWSSPPFDAALLDRAGLGQVLVGRAAVDMKGPQATLLAALHGIRAAGRRLPVNLVLVAEGEEEIGSPHLSQIVRRPDVTAALAQCGEVWMPFASQGPDGTVQINLGAKGIVELELVATGPARDVYSGLAPIVESPAWRLVQALSSLVSADGADPAIDGWFENVRPLTLQQRAMIAALAAQQDEKPFKQGAGVERWVRDLPFREALERLASQPTLNIEGLVSGHTGPGGKTILPSRAVAKLDLRLVPDMTAAEAVLKLKAHLARRGYADIEVNVSGGYDPTETRADTALVRAAQTIYRRRGIEPVLQPRTAGSWPGAIFTGAPLEKPAGHFGLGHGGGAHAADEYYLIESTNPRVAGMVEATEAYAQFLYALAADA